MKLFIYLIFVLFPYFCIANSETGTTALDYLNGYSFPAARAQASSITAQGNATDKLWINPSRITLSSTKHIGAISYTRTYNNSETGVSGYILKLAEHSYIYNSIAWTHYGTIRGSDIEGNYTRDYSPWNFGVLTGYSYNWLKNYAIAGSLILTGQHLTSDFNTKNLYAILCNLSGTSPLGIRGLNGSIVIKNIGYLLQNHTKSESRINRSVSFGIDWRPPFSIRSNIQINTQYNKHSPSELITAINHNFQNILNLSIGTRIDFKQLMRWKRTLTTDSDAQFNNSSSILFSTGTTLKLSDYSISYSLEWLRWQAGYNHTIAVSKIF